MKAFQHKNCQSLEEAVQLLAQNPASARPLAGGTDLLGILKDSAYPDTPDLLVNLKTIPGLDKIEIRADGLFIGALTHLDEIARHPAIRENYTVLAQAAQSVATPQIRRMATLGGNLCQEPRCWYYRMPGDLFHCIRKGGAVCGAVVGENRFHSIFGAGRVQDSPCTTHCPVATLIPDYLEEIRAGNYDNAARVLLATNPIPFITGRVCPHFCQEDCNRESMEEAIAIRDVERALGDYILEHGEQFYRPPHKVNGKKAAVIGSGPAGLAAAYELRRMGWEVTVFERMPEPGGMLRYAIPAYRLPVQIVERLIALLQGMGIVFRCGVEIGRDIPTAQLAQMFDAQLVATGAWKTPAIGIEGEKLTVSGLKFLKQIRLDEKLTPGQRVVVIGGGDVAVDVAMSARRLGAAQVTMVCLEKPEEMPALDWELDQAIEELVEVQNGWGPKRILAENGRLTGIELVRCTSVFDAQGRFAPTYDPQTTRLLEADAVFLAVGQRSELDAVPDGVQIERGRPVKDPLSGAASLPGVFIAGDISRPASVIDAVADGRRAAAGMHAQRLGPGAASQKPAERLHAFDPQISNLTPAERVEILSPELRQINLEDTRSFSRQTTAREASRCLNCGCIAVSPSDTGPALVALDAVMHTTRRTIPANEFFACGIKSSTILEQDELLTGVFIPKSQPGTRSTYQKYRLRQSIDFAVVSAAVRLDLQDGRIAQARVVLGAAAPTPLRAVQAEAFLQGRTLDEALAPAEDGLALPAGFAAALALAGAVPLAENGYKIQLARAYVRRAILACLTPR